MRGFLACTLGSGGLGKFPLSAAFVSPPLPLTPPQAAGTVSASDGRSLELWRPLRAADAAQVHDEATMTRAILVRLSIALVVAELAASIGLSMYLADRMARSQVSQRALGYARDVRARGEATGNEVSDGFERLAPLRDAPPCSPRELKILRAIDVASNHLQTMGRVVDGALVCTSYGLHVPPIALGPVAYVSPKRVRFRTDVQLPFAPGGHYLVLERDGFAAIVHKSSPLDVTGSERDAALAVVAKREGQVLTSRGRIDPAWMRREAGRAEFEFVDAGRVVAVSRSQDYNIVGVAALPFALVATQERSIGLLLVPFGALGGGVLAFVGFLVARLQLGLPALIRSGLRRREFFVHYQPIVDLHTGEWVGAEVLLRWRRDGELIRPDLFIAAAEESGLINAVTRRVLELVEPGLLQAVNWQRPFYFSINLAAADLHNTITLELLNSLVRRTGANPSRLRVEVTERGFARTDTARETVSAIRASGFLVSVDDFGTGYSSLSYLESFELDSIKIDKRFVDTLGAESVTSNVITHIIEMGRSLALELVAEGIETEAQAESLRARGVRFGQGWLYARAMPFDALAAAMAAER
jgi:sensor c-di-GMP phosphodiesterase-like protein